VVLGLGAGRHAPDEAAARKKAIDEFKVRPQQRRSLLNRKV
jgi:hypothetical protein